MSTLRAFTKQECQRAKILLAARVAIMMGRKLEEGDWSEIYHKAKGIPDSGWSNLHIDVNHNGLGVEIKLLRIPQLHGKSPKSVCGTTLMHPSATRSIRIDNIKLNANKVMLDVLKQYRRFIEGRTNSVSSRNQAGHADMRIGWLLWENGLREFLYFEEKMKIPNPNNYYAIWHDTPERGARKASKSLWIYEKDTNKKRYSVTTGAGVKIQPYFDVPPPTDPNLYYFCVQSERLDSDTVTLWVTAATARQLEKRLGSIDKQIISEAVLKAAENLNVNDDIGTSREIQEAVPIEVSNNAYNLLMQNWESVSDEHRIQLLLRSLD